MKARPSFVRTAIETAKIWSSRSEDPYKKVGSCILNREGRVLSVGYNGLPSKVIVKNKFWEDREKRRKYIIHAEINPQETRNKAFNSVNDIFKDRKPEMYYD
jgi:dCMP deaminase